MQSDCSYLAVTKKQIQIASYNTKMIQVIQRNPSTIEKAIIPHKLKDSLQHNIFIVLNCLSINNRRN